MGERVAGCTDGGDKDLGFAYDSGQGIDDLHGRPGEVHEDLLAGLVLETHDDTLAACPSPIELAEPAVAVPVGECLALLGFGRWQGSGERANRRVCPCSCLQRFIT